MIYIDRVKVSDFDWPRRSGKQGPLFANCRDSRCNNVSESKVLRFELFSIRLLTKVGKTKLNNPIPNDTLIVGMVVMRHGHHGLCRLGFFVGRQEVNTGIDLLWSKKRRSRLQQDKVARAHPEIVF